MTKQHFGTSHVPLSPAVRAGDFVFVSGQVPVDKEGKIVEGGIGPQTKKVLENVSAALALAGCRTLRRGEDDGVAEACRRFRRLQRGLRAVLP